MSLCDNTEILRTTFPLVNGRPVQLIHPPQPFVMPVIDLRVLPEDERGARVEQMILEQGQRPFDLEKDMMLRVVVLRLAEFDYVMILTEHHLVHDGGRKACSCAIFSRSILPSLPGKVRRCRSQLCNTRTSPTGKGSGYRVKCSRRSFLTGRSNSRAPPPFLELPADRPRPPVQSFRGGEQTLVIDRELAESLRAVSRQEGVTLFMSDVCGIQYAAISLHIPKRHSRRIRHRQQAVE